MFQLRNTLAKYPASAAYAHSRLGFEFMKTDQFAASRNYKRARKSDPGPSGCGGPPGAQPFFDPVSDCVVRE
jgi:hypothetical protein